MYDVQFANTASTVWSLVYQMCTAVSRVKERQLAKLGLSPEKMDVLWACKFHPGRVTPAELCRVLFRHSSSVAELLARMERQGLVRRIPKRKGHPFTEVQIADKGEELLQPGLEAMRALTTKMLSSLSEEELEQFEKLLRKLRDNGLAALQIEALPPPGHASSELVDI